MPRRRCAILHFKPPNDPEFARAIQLHRFSPTICYRHTRPADLIANTKRMLTLRHFPYAHRELAALFADDSFEEEVVTKVAVSALIEGTCEPNPRLD